MRRLFAIVGFTYLITLTVAMFLSEKALVVCLCLNAACFIVSVLVKNIRKNKIFPIALFTSLLGFGVYTANYNINILPIKQLYDKDINISGVICDIPYKNNGRYYYTIEVDKVVGRESGKKFKMSLSCSDALEADIYDKFTGNVHAFEPNFCSGFYSKQYKMSQKKYISGFLYDYQPVEIQENSEKPFNYYILKFREKMLSSMKSLLPETHATITNGVLLGEKQDLPQDIKNDFLRVGIYHLLAVSGIHVVLLCEAATAVFKKFKFSKRSSNLLTIAFILFFMAVNCFAPSVVRAGVMMIIYLIGDLFGRKSDCINSLGIAVLLMCAFNPNAGGDIRIWLSALSVLGINVLETKIFKFINNYVSLLSDGAVTRYLAKSVSMSLSVMIATFPVTVIFFKRLCLIAPISNILTMFPITFMIILSMVSNLMYVAGVSKAFIMPLLCVLKIDVDYVINVCRWLSGFPFACVSIEYKFISLWVSSVLILIGLSVIFGDVKKQVKFISLLSLNILFVGIISYKILMRDVTRLSVLDVGNGCSLVLSKNGRNSVICCGGEEYYCDRLGRYLDSINTGYLDLLLVPSSDEESSMFFNDVNDKFKKNCVVTADSMCVGQGLQSEETNTHFETFKDKIDIKLWNDIAINTYEAEDKTWMFLKIDNINILVCPNGGDAKNIPSKWLDCDIFITGSLPINYDLIHPVYNILSESKISCENNLIKLSKNTLNNYVTSNYGTINIDIKSPSTITIRRET